MDEYKYQDLPNSRTHIRVLHLAPGDGDDALMARLVSVEISTKPPYEAISYCWGSEERPCELVLKANNTQYKLSITTNLSDALRCLRNSSRDRILWTDAVCINQNDDERADQVRMMDKIYTAASKVLVYLAKPTNASEAAKNLLIDIHRAATEETNTELSPLQWVQTSRLPSTLESGRWEPLKAFFRLPWFRRKWTIQECALASNLEFHYGQWSCDGDWMFKIIDTIYDKGLAVTDHTTYSTQTDSQELQKGMSQINSIRLYRRGREQGLQYRFLDIVYHFQTAEAKDGRDHLYALLGMAADTDHDELMPEYKSLTVLDLCLRYAYFFLLRDKTLEVLYRAGKTENNRHAPSWVPNWYGEHQVFGFESGNGIWDPLQRPDHLNVTRGKIAITRPHGSVILGLKGMIIDKITDLAQSASVSASSNSHGMSAIIAQRKKRLAEIDRVTAQIENYSTGEMLEDVKWRTLMCNTTRQGAIPEHNFRIAYEAWRRVTSFSSDPRQLAADFAAAQLFESIVNVWNVDKVFGRTAEHFVGMFPAATKVGDQVVILLGGNFPFVVRPCGKANSNECELIGQCYVHGIMEEGQFDLQKRSSTETEILLGGFET